MCAHATLTVLRRTTIRGDPTHDQPADRQLLSLLEIRHRLAALLGQPLTSCMGHGGEDAIGCALATLTESGK